MYFYNPVSRESKELAPGMQAKTFWGEKMMLVTVALEPNATLPRHSHPHEQGGYVLAGELEFSIGEETRTLKPGDVYIIPGGVEHHVVNGPQTTQLVEIFTPVREEFRY